VTLLSRKNETFTLPLSTKREIASGILQRIWK
jgi:predicted RNA binding protein YcfA (HicA-like mRNA interferase family)